MVFCSSAVIGQPNLSFDLKKPPKFENKILGSEKTGNKKFTVPRRFIQNTFTHYNYYFNANNRLNEIIARAKSMTQDDYTQLLPFYNYSLKNTASFKTDLDSVIYKSTAGVLIHDLRNDWIDNLYILIGRAYYLRNDLDSAYLTFQYINYAFSPKEKDGYDKVIGSNEEGKSNAFSISTREKSNIVKRVFSEAPSRNESLVWQIRTYLAKDELAEASGLIETLRNDPLFPDRLKTDLEEVHALYFYKQLAYDSAALHLERALDNAEDNQEQARWEYLIAQLYEHSGKHDLAEKFYNRAIRHTINPVLEVYARLNSIRQNKNGNEKDIQDAIDALVKMARKDRYLAYRDIIYYTAALIEIERNNPDGAKALLLRSVRASTTNTAQKSRSFLQLGDLAYDHKDYTEAKNFYDSVAVQMVPPTNAKVFTTRKAALDKIVFHTAIIDRQDSLQRIASMPAADREAFIKNLVKQLRKQQGLRGDDSSVVEKGNMLNNSAAAADLFGGSSTKGEWYFANASLKAKGLTEFKGKWGNRPNADNWRRLAAISQSVAMQGQAGQVNFKGPETFTPLVVSYDAFLNNVPLTPEKLKVSKDSSENAMFGAGKAYLNGLEDYLSAISAFERLLNDFPASVFQEEALFNLYYCYMKTGNTANQAKTKQALASRFPTGKFTALLNISKPSLSPDSILKSKATAIYQNVYNMFIEGDFVKALQLKQQADSLYGRNYWTPQLLYIQAVYYIHQRSDSLAKAELSNIMKLFPNSPMFARAANLLGVLGRRKEIEEYLTNLDIERPVDQASVAANQPLMKQGPVITPKKIEPKPELPDSVQTQPARDAASSAVRDANRVALEKPAVTNSTGKAVFDSLKLANSLPPKEANSTVVKGDALQSGQKPAVVGNDLAIAPDSSRLANNLRKKVEDSMLVKENVPKPPTKPSINTGTAPPRADSAQVASKPPVVINSEYANKPTESHHVLIVLNKVDPVFATEARNAFNRYHRENYAGKRINITALPLSDDIKLILLNNFENAAEAFDYVKKTRALAPKEIIPWLTPLKYSFLLISDSNLELLKTKKSITSYETFLKELYPGSF